jgi:hypothetical protein
MTYIGSTASPLPVRLQQHSFRQEQFTKYEIGNYCGSFKIIEGSDYKIELIEEYPCNSKTELRMRERYWYDLERVKEGAVLANIILPYRFYADLQEQRRKTDAKRATNPHRIALRKSSNRRRYLLRQQLTFFNMQE